LKRGQSPDEVRSGLLDGARISERFFDRDAHENVVTVIQRAIDSALAESSAGAGPHEGQLDC
jgi:hypothetical protein